MELSEKLLTGILRRLNLHTLLKCRLISKELKILVDKVITLELLKGDRCPWWNPYFSIRRYFDLNSRNVLGFIRLESTSEVKRFVEEHEHLKRSTDDPSNPIPVAETKPVKTTTINAAAVVTPSKYSKDGKSRKGPPNKTEKASSLESTFFTTVPTQPSPSPGSNSTTGNLFPLGSLYIRRRLQDYNEESPKKVPIPPADKTVDIIHWTNILVQEWGSQLTSFTYDDGKRKGSDLNFLQLHSILVHLPNLLSLSVTSGNYQHGDSPRVKPLPRLPQLKYVNVGYNASFHLHQDILRSYGTQIKRLYSSKFGYFEDSSQTSTCNTLQKLLVFANGARELQPRILSSLEELKVPLLSSQNLMQQVLVMGAASPILWSNLRRFSIHYVYRPGQNDSGLADLWLFLNVVSPTLQELSLDFGTCSDFVEWISLDSRPLDRDVYHSCRRVRKLCISAMSLLKFADLCDHLCAKFPKVKILTFFNWVLYSTEAQENNFEGKYYKGGPRSPEGLDTYMQLFWKKIPNLQRISVRNLTWKGEGVYHEMRDNLML